MTMMLIGLALFVGAHLFATAKARRAALVAQIGEGPYKLAFTALSLVGLLLIVWGFHRYRAAGYIPVWTPPDWTRHVAITLMWFSFVSLAASYGAGSRIAGWLRHPMVNGVKFWATAHLIANGDLGSIILFGTILAWASWSRLAARWRGDIGAPRVAHFTARDAGTLIGGTLAWLAMIWLHPYLIGVPVVHMLGH